MLSHPITPGSIVNFKPDAVERSYLCVVRARYTYELNDGYVHLGYLDNPCAKKLKGSSIGLVLAAMPSQQAETMETDGKKDPTPRFDLLLFMNDGMMGWLLLTTALALSEMLEHVWSIE